jgi:hypothetical protein
MMRLQRQIFQEMARLDKQLFREEVFITFLGFWDFGTLYNFYRTMNEIFRREESPYIYRDHCLGLMQFTLSLRQAGS